MVEPSAPANAGREPEQDLAHELTLRDQRLAELTEYCLQILDRLSVARAELRTRDERQNRINRLEEVLRETRARVRAAGTVLLVPGAPASGTAEIVVWDATPDTAHACGHVLAAAGDFAVTVIPGDGVQAAGLGLPPQPGLRLLEGRTATPAKALNLAMQSTAADVVVCIRAGALPAVGTLEAMAQAAAATGIALACPALDRDGQVSLGCTETGPLQLTPAAVPAAETEQTAKTETSEKSQQTESAATVGDAAVGVAIDHADPAFLALPRAAYETIGSFDEDMTTDLVLAEWSLRARAHGWRLLGLPAAAATAPAASATDAAAIARDRLVAVSRHRPTELTAVAAAAGFFWREEPATLEPLLRAAFRRAVDSNHGGDVVEFLVAQGKAMAQAALPLPVLEQRIAALLQGIDPSLELAPGSPDGWFDQVRDALQRRLHDVEARHARGVEELRREIAHRDAALSAQREELIARIAQVAALEDQLLELQREFHEALTELQRRDVLHAELGGLLRDAAAHARSAAHAGTPLPQGLSLQEQLRWLGETLAQQRSVLDEREQWIEHLLREVQRRRLRARPLQKHEQAFLEHRRARP